MFTPNRILVGLSLLAFSSLSGFAAAPAAKPAATPVPPWQLSPEQRERQQKLITEDYADMMRQLGITKLRPGFNGSTAPGTPHQAN
ncbi:MAG: hypothetical protein ABI273_08430, partial [Lacunisphaera sp.]